MRKIILSGFVIYLLGCLILGGLIIYKMRFDEQWLVDIKYSFFTDFTTDLNSFNNPPTLLSKNEFKTDSSELVRNWASLIFNEVDYMHLMNKDMLPSSEIEKAKSIILMFSKNGGADCASDISLLDKIKRLPNGHGYGCCSDHAKVFIALSSVLGLTAREVHTVGHVTNEFYDYELSKWIWTDPLYAILARNDKGEYLSLMQIRDLYYNNKSVYYEFFGNKFHYFSKHNPAIFSLYDKDRFSNIMITWGNNVFTEDKFNENLKFMPKFIRQFLGIKLGIVPLYIKYVDAHNTLDAHVLNEKKYIYNGIFISFVVGSIFFPSYFMIVYKYQRNHEK